MADSRPGWFRRIVFWSFVLLVVGMITSHSDSFAQEPPMTPLPPNGNAAGGGDAAAAQQDMDPEFQKIREAAALAAQQVLHRLEALKAREPKPPAPWAKVLDPGDPVPLPFMGGYRMPDGTLCPVFGGVHPLELRGRVRELARTGRISKAEFLQFVIDIKNIPLGLHALP